MIAELEKIGAYVIASGAVVARVGLSDAVRLRLYGRDGQSGWLQTDEGEAWWLERAREQADSRAAITGTLTYMAPEHSASFDQVHLDSLVRALAVDGAAPELHKAMEAEVERLMKKLGLVWKEAA